MTSEREEAEEIIGGGLDFGIAAFHIRILVENEWHGGCGYTLEQVALMTPDQVYFRLCDKGIFAGKPGSRTARTTPHKMAEKDGDGTALVRCADGTLKRMRYGGKSRARQLMEEAAARRAAEAGAMPNTRRGRRERRIAEQRKAREEAEKARHRDRRRG